MEGEPRGEPDDENLVYMDEFPEAKKRVWLRRLNNQRRLGETAMNPFTRIYQFPSKDPDGDQPA